MAQRTATRMSNRNGRPRGHSRNFVGEYGGPSGGPFNDFAGEYGGPRDGRNIYAQGPREQRGMHIPGQKPISKRQYNKLIKQAQKQAKKNGDPRFTNQNQYNTQPRGNPAQTQSKGFIGGTLDRTGRVVKEVAYATGGATKWAVETAAGLGRFSIGCLGNIATEGLNQARQQIGLRAQIRMAQQYEEHCQRIFGVSGRDVSKLVRVSGGANVLKGMTRDARARGTAQREYLAALRTPTTPTTPTTPPITATITSTITAISRFE